MICGSSDWLKYCDIENKKYSVVICKCCSFVRLSPIPSSKELDIFYSNLYRKKYSGQDIVSETVVAYEQLRANDVVRLVKPYFERRFSNVLDIGCSSGTLLKNISKLSEKPNLYGIEKNDNYRNFILENNLISKENLTNENIDDYYIGREQYFDFISIVHVLEHLKSPDKTLESIRRLLKNDGILYVEVPNLDTPYNNLRKKYFAIYHLYYFSDITLRILLEKVGFKILESGVVSETSVYFICKNNTTVKSVTCISQEGVAGQYMRVVKALKYYEKRYPLLFAIKATGKILEILGLKNFIKKILNNLNK
nr:class I SAM-dependent methyltransferase [Campylobacter mucosalis]